MNITVTTHIVAPSIQTVLINFTGSAVISPKLVMTNVKNKTRTTRMTFFQ